MMQVSITYSDKKIHLVSLEVKNAIDLNKTNLENVSEGCEWAACDSVVALAK